MILTPDTERARLLLFSMRQLTPLEQICMNLLVERQIDDAGQRDEQQYFDQLTDYFKSEGIAVEQLHEEQSDG